MWIHPSVAFKARRLVWYLPLAGLIAGVTYLMSLSRCAFPGRSAALMAESAGLIPSTGAAHPLFALLARQVAAWDVGSFVVRMNAFPAVCGSLCAMLLAHVVARLILFAASEDGGGAEKSELAGEEGEFERSGLSEEIEKHNRRVFRVAAAGGLFAGVLFAFTAATWTAATRLETGLFHVMLGLASLSLFPLVDAPGRGIRLVLSVCLFTFGLFDSVVFFLFLPCYAYLLFDVFMRTDRRAGMVLLVIGSGLVAAAMVTAAYWMNQSDVSLRHAVIPYMRGLARQHLAELRFFFPRSGWLLVVLQVGLPGVLLLFGRQILFRERKVNTIIALFLIVIAVLPGLLGLPIAPFDIFQRFDHLPVFVSVIAASATACAFAGCWIFLLPDERVADLDLSTPLDDEFEQRLGVLRGITGALLAIIVLLAIATPFRSFGRVDARRGDFADMAAREILEAMKERTCLVTNGLIDNHLLIQAHLLDRKLSLIKLRSLSVADNKSLDTLRLIEKSPLFEGLNRQRLSNAFMIDPVRFVMEWVNSDKKASDKVMFFATPDIWTACGYRAVPEGFAFGGLPADKTVDMKRVLDQNRAFADRMAPVFARTPPRTDFAAGLRLLLRTRAGFSANELGVLLEEQGDFEAAYDAYLDAVSVDPQNVSAAVNVYELSRQRLLHPEMGDILRKRMRAAVSHAKIRSMQGITWALQNYGTIRQQVFYQQQATQWSLLGARMVAADKIRKGQTLSERTGIGTLMDNAPVYLQTGDRAKAEACYSAVLEKEPENRDALIALCTLALGQKRIQDAEKWYRQALQTGVEPLALRYQTVMLAILKDEKKQALELLITATREVPSDLRYWTLMADLLLERGDFLYVERQLLPNMQKALKTADHFMIHVIRGTTLYKKGPEFYKEARLSLLAALARNAALPEVWNDVLKLDCLIGDATFTESDARRLLGLDPEHALANYLMGASLLSRNKVKESEDFLRRSIEKKTTAAACNDLAENLRLQKRLDEAESFARRALKLEPDFVPAQDKLARILLDRGRFEEAAQVAGQAVATQPDFPAYRLTLLRAQVKLGNKDKVLQQVETLSRSQTELPETLVQEINAMR